VPISAATLPGLPKPAERLYASLPPIPWRGALARAGLRPVWLRPSYTAVADMKVFARRLKARGLPFNVIFHSSEILPGGSPYTPDDASVRRFLDALRALLDHVTSALGARGRTYGELAAGTPAP
jgi:hypothetical protein